MDIACAVLDEEMEGDLRFLDLLEVFSENDLIRFMKVFSGRTLRVPSKGVIVRACLAATCFLEVEGSRRKLGFEGAVMAAAMELKMDAAKVRKFHAQVLEITDEMDRAMAEMRKVDPWANEAGQQLLARMRASRPGAKS